MRYVTMWLLILAVAPASQGRIEITPFGGHQGGGEFDDYGSEPEVEIEDDSVYGVAVGFGHELGHSQLELYFSRQETELVGADALSGSNLFELDVDYYHIGGVLLFDQGKLQPYMVGSLGATRFDFKSSSFDSEVEFSMSLGGGVKWFPSERVGVRLEGRVFGTFVNTESVAATGPRGTVVVGRTDMLVQYNVTVGLIFVIP
jgi:hypothetical protein